MAIVDEERLIVEGFLQTRKTHSERLLPLVDLWLREAEISLDDIDGIAVTVGPGSFTGLRIGLATAKGLAQATGKAIMGIPTLDALAMNLTGVRGLICPILDARKSEVYSAVYISPEPCRLVRISEYLAVSPDLLLEWLQNGTWPSLDLAVEVILESENKIPIFASGSGWDNNQYLQDPINFLGDAVPVYWERIQKILNTRANRSLLTHNWLRAAQVAFLGLKALNLGRVEDYRLIRPIYIRASEAEVKLRKGVES
jgi:tRNA threonylcarbamoyladenosine biosynthesis protein TsaB